MSKTLATLILIAGLLGGCQTSKLGNFCETEKPYYFSQAELKTLSKEQKQFHVSRNEYGEKNCGWKASSKWQKLF